MGMNRVHLQLIKNHLTGTGTALSLGYPDVHVPIPMIRRILGIEPVKRFNNSHRKEMVDAVDMFNRMGFELTVIDIQRTEGMEQVYDLTRELPTRFRAAFDFIIDPGTLEHLQYPGIGLKNVYWMSKPGGIILHHTPFGRPNHGLFNLNPKLFDKFYSNGDEILYKKVLLGDGSTVNVGKLSGNLILLVKRGKGKLPKEVLDSVK